MAKKKVSQSGAPEIIHTLVAKFAEHSEEYKRGNYNEEQLRQDFLNPFFAALGWDMDNRQGYSEKYREVIHEDAIRVEQSVKAPDYCFRIGGVRQFFVEAKKPAVNIKDDIAPAFQLRRYAWTAKLPLSILTDFEELAVYDCRVKPDKKDKASVARVMFIKYTEYVERWQELVDIFSPDSIRRGAFDKYAESKKKKRGTAEVDEAFLEEIEGWREALAKNLSLRNQELTDRELNFSVQRIIDRIIFLRMCEGRGIEPFGKVQALLNGDKVYARLVELFHRADEKYNSGLFHFHQERGREEPDTLTTTLQVDDKVLKAIVKRLYYPESPYEFAALPADILGQVYEQFLGKVIRLTKGHKAKIEEKPEVRKAGGVYYTPTYIVDYIVENTVGKLLEGKTHREVGALTQTYQPKQNGRPLTVLDPACGSGSFLIVAYQYLLDWYLKQYTEVDKPEKHSRGKNPRVYQTAKSDWRLTSAERKRILLAHIYGVDIDYQAVEVTKLSLLLKVLEGETEETLQRQLFAKERALPDLSDNIKCGNSLIGSDFYRGQQLDMFDEEERLRINVFDWEVEFPKIFSGKNPGFDAVIGNPPYIRVGNVEEHIRPYLYKTYDINHRFDIYVVFVRRGFDLITTLGRFGFIVPNKFFTSDYGKSLRSYLKNRCAISDIVDFGDKQVFAGATIYTCLLFLSKQSSATLRYTVATTDRSAVGFLCSHSFSVATKRLSDKPWAFVDESTAALLDRLNELKKLNEICEFQRGLETGADSVFLLSECEEVANESTVYVKSHAEDSPFEIESAAIRRVVKGAVDVRRYFIEESNRYVLFPYKIVDGRPVAIDEQEFAETKPLAWDYLKRHAQKLRDRKKPGDWYTYRRRNYDLRDGVARLLVPSIGLRASFAPDFKGDYHFVGSGGGGGGGYGLSLRRGIDMSFHYILGLLNSKLLDWLVKLSNSRFGHGYYSFNRQYIESLPIRAIDSGVNCDESSHDEIVGLVVQITTLYVQLAAAKTPQEQTTVERQIAATDREIDQLVYELYGLTDKEIKIVEEATA